MTSPRRPWPPKVIFEWSGPKSEKRGGGAEELRVPCPGLEGCYKVSMMTA